MANRKKVAEPDRRWLNADVGTDLMDRLDSVRAAGRVHLPRGEIVRALLRAWLDGEVDVEGLPLPRVSTKVES